MSEKLKVEFPTQGWRQFLTSRKEMLDTFDSAREKARGKKVEVLHGRAAEAVFRQWLSGFLPKRYDVTSGYIVSPGRKHTEKTPHFDVIIYDRLEAPVLWVEGHPDVSHQGRSLAIPVEYVHAVLEVKATFSPSNVKEAIEHLKELSPLTGGLDAPNERYKLHLPTRFLCGIVFFDLNKKYEHSELSLTRLVGGLEVRGFRGGLVLRGEGHQKALTGRLLFGCSVTPSDSTIGRKKESLLDGFVSAKSQQIADNDHIIPMLQWTESGFSQFSFDLIATMQGTYDGRVSSWYGMGRSEEPQ